MTKKNSKFNGLLSSTFKRPNKWKLTKSLTFKTDLWENEIQMFRKHKIDVKFVKDTMTVPRGYITDMASVPRGCWAFIAPFDVARAAVIHDIMYEKINGAFKKGIIESKKEREIYRKIADDIFLEGMESAEPPVSKWKIKSAYYAVRMFGRWAINSSAPRG